jgi:prepilin-type N-terminal cleavage/methylation domain-containing protein
VKSEISNPKSQIRNRKIRDRGFSLLEVLLALAILVGALAAIGTLVDLGMRHARASRELTQAQLLCESKLNEIAAGITIAEVVSLAPLDNAVQVEGEEAGITEAPEWLYSVEVLDARPEFGLAAVRVTVTQDGNVVPDPVSYSLMRWVTDANVVVPPPPMETETTEGTTSGSSSGNASSSTGTGGSS